MYDLVHIKKWSQPRGLVCMTLCVRNVDGHSLEGWYV